ncbi:MAG: glucan 1,4-alpha-glucosidase [Microbacteriaceae bacterium]|nr:glucan 1,4-alpha-glucosidase [Microbacteriaceae bacterium]
MTEATRGQLRADLATMSRLAETSVELILRLQDPSGAYPASPTFSAYTGYSWFRDGAFIADGMSAAGAVDSASRFFDWCAGILHDRKATIGEIVARAAAGDPVPDTAMLPTRFTFAGTDGDDDWWDFQLDGYGTWLWAVAEHAERHALDLARWQQAIDLTVDYLLSSWQRPCFDWWEENADRVHVSTLGCIAAGLAAVAHRVDADRGLAIETVLAAIRHTIADRGTTDGHLAKWLGSTEVDASLLSTVAPLAVFPATEGLGAATVRAVDAALAVNRGVHRYAADTFFGGGQWPLLSCFLGLAYAAGGDRESALDQLSWAASTVDVAGNLPEQVAWDLLDRSRQQEWIDRWGPVARPLLWSHAMFIRLAVEVDVLKVLSS